MELFALPETWLALLTLTLLEIVLGIDNIIFISIISRDLPDENQFRTRTTGLVLALFFRLILLFGITWVAGFTRPLFPVFGMEISVKDLIMISGGLFLLARSTSEIHKKMLDKEEEYEFSRKVSPAGVILQIVLLDMVFSFDSILTAIGLTRELILMIIAVSISMLIMILFVGKVSELIHRHPSLQVLALAFLILIGFILVLEGVEVEVPRGYVYFAVFFSLAVEVLNIRFRKKQKKWAEIHGK